MLAPGDPEDAVQVLDVRDLAAWIVRCAEDRVPGVFDAVGPALPIARLLGEVAAGCGVPEPALTWVDQDSLDRVGVSPWAGPHSLPLWLPRPAYDGMMTHDPDPARAAGLVARPVAETAADTLAWLRARPTPWSPASAPRRRRACCGSRAELSPKPPREHPRLRHHLLIAASPHAAEPGEPP